MSVSMSRILPMAMACVLGASAAAQAADTAPETVMMITDVSVEPVHAIAFETGVKAWIACIKEHGSTHGITAMEAETGSSSWVFASPSLEWSKFDEKDPAGKACRQIFADSVLPNTASVKTRMYVYQPDLSLPPADIHLQAKYESVDEFRVKPGKYAEFKDAVKEFTAAAAKAKWNHPWWTSTLAFGDADAADVIKVNPGASWAEIGAPTHMRKTLEGAIGKDKTDALYQKLRDSTEYLSSNVYRYDADLSYQPKAK